MTENVKKLAHQLIEWGVLHGAQDVYFLPNDTEIAIFFRTGMQRTPYTQVSAEIGEKLIFHFKFIGGMDVGERRKAQLGAFIICGRFSESRELGNSFFAPIW